jgi:predicted Zn-dependent protease
LLRHNRQAEALDVVRRAIKSSPDNADLLLMSAIVLGLMEQNSGAEKALKEIESRWPEWDRPYLAHGLLLERGARPTEAKHKLQTAVALGSPDLAGRCAIARLAASPSPDPKCACQIGLYQLLFPSCDHD